MTTIDSVFNYLNHFDPSKLRPLVDPIVTNMKSPALTDAQLDAHIRDALEKSQYPFVTLENAEIKIRGGLAKYARGRFYESKILFEEALHRYDQDPHRKAVTLWLLGMNALAMEEPSQAHQYWFLAREALLDLSRGKQLPVSRPDLLSWYKDRGKEINRIMATTCIQEIYSWLDVHEHGHLDEQTQDYYKKIQESITSKKYHEAHQFIDSLLHLAELGNDHDQLREVLVFCGVAKYQLGSSDEALKYFNKAITLLTPGSHRQAIAYWLLGMTQWRIPRLREDAIINLKEAIFLFKELRMDADRKHNPLSINWYDEKLVFMQDDLKEKVKILLG